MYRCVRYGGGVQVTVEYRNEGGRMIPLRVHTIVISTQHSPDVTNEVIRADLRSHVINHVVPAGACQQLAQLWLWLWLLHCC